MDGRTDKQMDGQTVCCEVSDFHSGGRLRLKRDDKRAQTRFRLSAKRTNPFKSAGASVHSITGSRVVRISGSNAGYTMFRGSVKGTGYPLHSPVSPSLPLPLRHRVPSHFNWTLPTPVLLNSSRHFEGNAMLRIFRRFTPTDRRLYSKLLGKFVSYTASQLCRHLVVFYTNKIRYCSSSL
jgi:hypothetical protein